MSTHFWPWILGCALLFAPGCAPRTDWYHPEKPKAAFQEDLEKCRRTAEAASRHKTIRGKDPELASYYEALELCLGAKGWSVTPPSAASGSFSPDMGGEFQISENSMRGFGLDIPLPAGVVLTEQPVLPTGNVRQRVWAGAPVEGGSIHLAFQVAATSMEQVDYPINPPFFVYSRHSGTTRTEPTWTAFAGRYDEAWVGGIGIYRLLKDHNRRIISVVTWPLPEPEAPPREGLRLTDNQKQAMDRGVTRWTAWLQDWDAI